MADATLTEYGGVPIPGVKKGSCVAQNAYTSYFGLKTLHGVLLTAGSSEGNSVGATLSSGQATITIKDNAGNAVSADRTLYYWAWGV